jgi:hypothetical protein
MFSDAAAIKRLLETHERSNARIPINWREEEANDGDDEVEWEPIRSQQDFSDAEPFVPPSDRDDAPLAGMLNERLRNADPRSVFPSHICLRNLKCSGILKLFFV